MRSRVYVTVERPSVCVYAHRSTAATAAGGYAAERPGCRRYRPIAAGAVQQMPALRNECGQRHVDSWADGGGWRRRCLTWLCVRAENLVPRAERLTYSAATSRLKIYFDQTVCTIGSCCTECAVRLFFGSVIIIRFQRKQESKQALHTYKGESKIKHDHN